MLSNGFERLEKRVLCIWLEDARHSFLVLKRVGTKHKKKSSFTECGLT